MTQAINARHPISVDLFSVSLTVLDPANQLELRAAAMKWLNLGIEHNLPNAFHNMGAVYYYADHDVEKGREWFKKGADSGLALSAYAIGTTYEAHENNPDKAYEWYEKAMTLGSEKAAHLVCNRFRDEAERYRYPSHGSEKELSNALECYEKAASSKYAKDNPSKYEWVKKDANEFIDKLSEGASDIDIDGLERIVARAKAVCQCEYEKIYSRFKLMRQLNALRVYKANFDARKNIIPPGEILVSVPEKHAHYFHACQMSWISADTKGEAYHTAKTGNVSCKSNDKGDISFEKDYSDLIRQVLAKGDTILLTDSFGTISYMTYKTCDSKPCLVSALYQLD